jgi:arsenate reductase
MAPHYNVLFLDSGNSVRSIFAEAILNRKGGSNFTAFSAGAHPRGQIHPPALSYLKRAGLPTAGLHSKSWDEFAKPGAPAMDFVFTLCDKARREPCPIWQGHPITGHWSILDPTAATGTPEQIEFAVADAFTMLERRISLFLALPFPKLEQIALGRGKKQRAAAG